MGIYNKEEYSKYDNIMDYIKRLDYSYIVISKDKDFGEFNFEVMHKYYIGKRVEQMNFEINTDVKKVYLVNSKGEMVSVVPDLEGNDLNMVFNGGVEIEKNMNNLTKIHKYLVVVSDDAVNPVVFKDKMEVIDMILTKNDSVESIYKIDGNGSVSKVEYKFNNFKVELQKSREWLRTVRDYRKILKEETRKRR